LNSWEEKFSDSSTELALAYVFTDIAYRLLHKYQKRGDPL